MNTSPDPPPPLAPQDRDRARRLMEMYVTSTDEATGHGSEPKGFAPPVVGTVFVPPPPPPTSNVGTIPTRPDAAILMASAATVDGSAPSLPIVSLPVPSAPHPTVATSTSSYGVGAGVGAGVIGVAPAGKAKDPQLRDIGGSIRRFLGRVLLLAVVAGLAAVGVMYGPELYERYRGEEESSTSTADEPPAPLALPAAPLTPPAIRTATVDVERTFTNGDRTELTRTTIDFDTGATRTVFDRPDGVDVEILTLFEDAVVRPLNAPVWYSMPRGGFPAADTLDRNRLVPTVDAIVAPEQRASTLISEATYSSVNGVPATRLVIKVGETPREIWVDDAGIVRKQVVQTTLGTETITVTDVSAEAWLPDFPTAEQIQPMTAAALVELGM